MLCILIEFLDVSKCCHREFVHLCNGLFEDFMIATTKTPWRWQVWCAETCCRIDNVWRMHLVLVKLVLRTERNLYAKCTSFHKAWGFWRVRIVAQSVYQSVCTHVRISAASVGRIAVRFDIWGSVKICRGKPNLVKIGQKYRAVYRYRRY